MKANAPEKLYVDVHDNLSDSILYGFTEKRTDDDIEYTRTDVFIEKSQNFFRRTNYLFHLDGMELSHFIEEFRNYIKEL